MGSGLAARGIVRHRLGPAAVSRPWRRTAADHRLVLRTGAGKGRDRTSLRSPTKAAFRPGISSTGCRSRPSATARSCAAIVKEAGAEADAAGKRILELASRCQGLRHPNRKEAPAFKAELKGIAGGADIIARGLEAYRAGPDRPAQILALHHLLERQHYKLGHWRLASSDINYRRFFDVNTLAGLRVEDAGTFDAIHRLVKKLIAEDRLQGLRLDHIDGLRDPAQYFQRLRRLIRRRAGERRKAVLHGDREDSRRTREAARLQRRARHHRL